MKNEIFKGVITTDLITEMKVGQTLKIDSELFDSASTRMSEVNKSSRIIDKPSPKRWTLFSRTKELGYITITRMR